MKQTIALSIISILFSISTYADFDVKYEKENVVASRLIGTWKGNAELAKRLADGQIHAKVTFTRDDKVAKMIPEKLKMEKSSPAY